jgi:hypothetical protein
MAGSIRSTLACVTHGVVTEEADANEVDFQLP